MIKIRKKTRLASLLLTLALLLPAVALATDGVAPSPTPPAASQEPIQESPTQSRQHVVTDTAALKGFSEILDTMTISAERILLMDADNDEVLYAKASHEKAYPASITKVMTALLAVEAIDQGRLSIDQVITVGAEYAVGIGEGGSTQGIKEGEQLTMRDLLNCALIPSANEACNALAQAVSGSVSSFVELMNQRSAELGMKDTHWTNTHGYHDDNHYTTAYDIYLMCREAMKHERFREIVSSKSYTVPATNLHAERVLHDTNALVSTFRVRGFFYEYCTGIKTGSTPEAGYCLASSATKDGKNLIAVVLGGRYRENGTIAADNYFAESKRLLEWGFQNFTRQTIIDSVKPLKEVAVTLSKEADYVSIYPDGSIEATLPKDIDSSKFERQITYIETVEAPVKSGQVLGTVTLSYGGQAYGTLNLVAMNDVERSELLYRLDRIKTFFRQPWVKILLVVLLVVFVLLVIWLTLSSKRRRRYGTKSGGGRRNYGGRRRR